MALRDELLSRLPAALKTALKPVGKLCVEGYVRFSHLDEVNSWLQQNLHLSGLNFVEEALDFLNARALFDPDELELIPRSGAAIVVANHPLGGLDALLLLKLVSERRQDVKILANEWLLKLKPLQELMIPVSVFRNRERSNARDAALDALTRGELLIVFPGAEVARLSTRGVVDPRWHLGFVHLARKSAAPIIPVHVGGRNSLPFYLTSLALKPLGTALLPRELMRARGSRVPLRIGAPMRVSESAPLREQAEQVRTALHALPKPVARPSSPFHLPRAVDPASVKRDLARLSLIGETPDGKLIYCGKPGMGSSVMREIARLRELSFRAVGEGSGRRFDWDQYDLSYDQLILWNAEDSEIAGAYRMKPTQGLNPEGLEKTLYSASLFHFGEPFAQYLAQGCELGRSFVAPKYWGSRSLDDLWFGIGAYLNRHPTIRFLFGPVSASAALGEAARALLLDYYARHFRDQEGLAQAIHPYRLTPLEQAEPLDSAQEFALLKANLAALGAKVPTLYRQYTELCEPGGVRFLAFGVDPAFAQCVDGLILLDLKRLKAKKRERYFERSIAQVNAACF